MINKLKANKLGALTTNKVTPDKVNEIIDAVNNAGLTYKVYTVLLSQSGTSAPVATVLQNTLGGKIVWVRVSAGLYTATLTGAFPLNKTAVIIGALSNLNGTKYQICTIESDSQPDQLIFTTVRVDAGNQGNTDYAFEQTLIEIRIYN